MVRHDVSEYTCDNTHCNRIETVVDGRYQRPDGWLRVVKATTPIVISGENGIVSVYWEDALVCSEGCAAQFIASAIYKAMTGKD